MDDDSFDEIMRIQQMMSQRIVQERHVDHKIDILNIVNDLTVNNKKTQVEAVVIEAKLSGISERETVDLLDELERDHLIKRNDSHIERA